MTWIGREVLGRYCLLKIEELKCSKHTQEHVTCGLISIPIKQLPCNFVFRQLTNQLDYEHAGVSKGILNRPNDLCV